MGRLSTHVLDTTHGRPGAGMRYALYRLDGERREKLAEGATDADGRADAALLEEDAYQPGRYQLVYQVAAYFRGRGVDLPEPPFLDEVTLSFCPAVAPFASHGCPEVEMQIQALDLDYDSLMSLDEIMRWSVVAVAESELETHEFEFYYYY